MRNINFLFKTITFFCLLISLSPAAISSDTTQLSGCEETRDRLQIRLEMAQELQKTREAQLADVVVRYARLEEKVRSLEAEIKALKDQQK